MRSKKKISEQYMMWTTTTTFEKTKFSYIIKKEEKK